MRFIGFRGNAKSTWSTQLFLEFLDRLQHLPSPSEFCNERPTTHEKHFSMRLRAPQRHPYITKKEKS